MTTTTIPVNTDRVRHAWKGDWNHFNNGQTGAVYYTEDSHYVWIPNGTTLLQATLTATEADLDTGQVGTLQLSIDLDDDGSNDGGQGVRLADSWFYEIDVDESSWGKWAHFDTTGQAVTLFGILDDPEFFESHIPYTVDVMLTLDLVSPVDIAFEQRPDFYSDLDPAPPSEDYDDSMDGMLTFTRLAYDQQTVVGLIQPKATGDDGGSNGFISSLGDLLADHPFAVMFFMLLILLGAGGAGYALRERKDYAVDLVLDAEISKDED